MFSQTFSRNQTTQMMGTMITSTNDFAYDNGQEEDLKYMVVRSKAKMKPTSKSWHFRSSFFRFYRGISLNDASKLPTF